jgi:hypothetical protein
MSRLSVDSIFSGLSSGRISPRRTSNEHTNQTHQILTFRPSYQADSTIIDRTSPSGAIFPLFSFTKSKKSKPNVTVYRIGAGNSSVPQTFIGDASVHSTSSCVKMTLHGQPIKMKTSELSGSSYKFENSMGKFKWKSDSIASGALALLDASGMKLARYTPGERLEILVPCDDTFLDLVILSGLGAAAMKAKDKKDTEIIGEVLGGLLGG